MLLFELINLAICAPGSTAIEAIFCAGAEIRPINFALNSSSDGSFARKSILSLSIFSPLKPPPIILKFSNFFSKLTATFAGATDL